MSERDWKPIDTAPEGVVVDTKIDGGRYSARNFRTLVRRGRAWLAPDRLTRVFYTPTHWRQQVMQ